MPSLFSCALSGCEEGVSGISSWFVLWLLWVSFLCVISLLLMLFFFILIQITMPVFGTFWFVLILFDVSENHNPIACMSTGLGSIVNPLTLNSLTKKKWCGIWEVLKNKASTLKGPWDVLWHLRTSEAEESRRNVAGLLFSFSTFCWARGVVLLKKYYHCIENWCES